MKSGRHGSEWTRKCRGEESSPYLMGGDESHASVNHMVLQAVREASAQNTSMSASQAAAVLQVPLPVVGLRLVNKVTVKETPSYRCGFGDAVLWFDPSAGKLRCHPQNLKDPVNVFSCDMSKAWGFRLKGITGVKMIPAGSQNVRAAFLSGDTVTSELIFDVGKIADAQTRAHAFGHALQTLVACNPWEESSLCSSQVKRISSYKEIDVDEVAGGIPLKVSVKHESRV